MLGLGPVFGYTSPPRFGGEKRDIDALLADIDDLLGPAPTTEDTGDTVSVSRSSAVEEAIQNRIAELEAEIIDPSKRHAENKRNGITSATSTVSRRAKLELVVIRALDEYMVGNHPDRKWILTLGEIVRHGVQVKQPDEVKRFYFKDSQRAEIVEAVLKDLGYKLQWQ